MTTDTTQRQDKPATIQDVARRAGVAATTVSFVLNKKGNISLETRELVHRVAAELNYTPNPHARRLANGRAHQTIALYDCALDFGIGTRTMWFLQYRLEEMDFEVELYTSSLYVAHKDERQVSILNRVRQQKPGAIVCNTAGLGGGARHELEQYRREGGILLCYGHRTDMECDQVVFDRIPGVGAAVQHLYDLGHREIGFCCHGPCKPENEFVQGFCQATHKLQLEVPDQWMWGEWCDEEAGGKLAEKFISLKHRPTALCVINDISAAAFVHSLLRTGLSVPDDVSVVGHDDLPAASHAVVPLTTVSRPVESIGRHVVDLLCSRLNGTYAGPPRSITVQGELQVRQSTAPR